MRLPCVRALAVTFVATFALPHGALAQRIVDLQPVSALPPLAAPSMNQHAYAGSIEVLADENVESRRWSVGRSALAGAAVGFGAVLVYAAFRCSRSNVSCGSNDATAVPFLVMNGGGAAILGGVAGGLTAWLLNRGRSGG